MRRGETDPIPSSSCLLSIRIKRLKKNRRPVISPLPSPRRRWGYDRERDLGSRFVCVTLSLEQAMREEGRDLRTGLDAARLVWMLIFFSVVLC